MQLAEIPETTAEKLQSQITRVHIRDASETSAAIQNKTAQFNLRIGQVVNPRGREWTRPLRVL